MYGRAWTPDEIKFLEENFRALTAEAMANALGRTLPSTRQALLLRGLTKNPRVIDHARLSSFIRRLHAKGWSDAEIAAAWNAKHPDKHCSREWLCEVRRDKLGLPHNAFSKHRRRRVAAKTREQLEKAGLSSLADVRVKAFSDFGARNGWPGINRPRAVQILNLLYERGPHTRQQIAAAIGMPWKGSRKSLVGNGPGGSYLAELMRMKLVVQLPGRPVAGKGRGRSCRLYAIAPHVHRQLPTSTTPKARKVS